MRIQGPSYRNARGKQQKESDGSGFFDYWDELGFFDVLHRIIPPQFMQLFKLARVIQTSEKTKDAVKAIEDVSADRRERDQDRSETIRVQRKERIAPVGNHMEITPFRSIHEMKRVLPRELAIDELFDLKFLTGNLLVQRFYESDDDFFRPVGTSNDPEKKDAHRFEQKFYLLMDRSKSMKLRMRNFYAKAIVIELLRAKMKSGAKIYYRAFDNTTGKLHKLASPADFSRLIERIVITLPQGSATNIQGAILQAVRDIEYDKDLRQAEILMVTDGVSSIDRKVVKEKLGNIHLHVIKIGDELPRPDFFSLKSRFADEEDTLAEVERMDMKELREYMDRHSGRGSDGEMKIYSAVFEESMKVENDLRAVSKTYNEVQDIDTSLIAFSDEDVNAAISSYDELKAAVEQAQTSNEKSRLYKQAYFLAEYLSLMAEQRPSDSRLKRLITDLENMRHELLHDPELYLTFRQTDGLGEDKKRIKATRKDVRKMRRQMKATGKDVSLKKAMDGQISFGMGGGGGSGTHGGIILLLWYALVKAFKKLFRIKG